MSAEDNRRIAKNTGMLYIRMLLTMAVTLYTSRIVLKVLGVEDFGIYHVVGGFVAMVGFLNQSMAVATQRFLSFGLGRKDPREMERIFSMSINIHGIIAVLLLILAETAGSWFVQTQLNIPPERAFAVNWVYQWSVLAFIVHVVSVPYQALIIAHERMGVYAWISIGDVLLKLFIVFALEWFGFDRLKLYALLMFVVSLTIRLAYVAYCSMNFRESRYRFSWDKPLFTTLLSFAGWNLWGTSASVLSDQGVNVLLNIFFGPVVNAARGIAWQVRAAVNGFVHNFQMALNPQIIKSFAADDLAYMHQLIFRGAKYSFFLLFAFSLPILLETAIILRIWLKVVPDYSLIFTRLIILQILIDSISGPLMTGAQASGNIRLYQAVVGGLLLLTLPISYGFLRFGYSPEITLWISNIISVIALFARLWIITPLIHLSLRGYMEQVVARIVPVAAMAVVVPWLVRQSMPESYSRLAVVTIIALGSVFFAVYMAGLTRDERVFVAGKARYVWNNFRS